MAQKVSVTFACDYDRRKSIPAGQQHSRRFSLDGRDYEIDLCTKHSAKFDDVVGRCAQRARRASARVGQTERRATAHRQHSAAKYAAGPRLRVSGQ